MADYKRMVSYMYQYENGVKKKNVGYARIEAKNGQCKITLHMQLLGQLDSIFPTYLIHRDGSNLELIYLGDTVLKNQVMDSKLLANEASIMDTGHSLSDMGGMLLFLNDKVFFATEWDDKPIIAKDVLEALKPKKAKENRNRVPDNKPAEHYEAKNEELDQAPTAEAMGSTVEVEATVEIKDQPVNGEDLRDDAVFQEMSAVDQETAAPLIEVSFRQDMVNEAEAAQEQEINLKASDVVDEMQDYYTAQKLSLEEELKLPKYKLPRGWKTMERIHRASRNEEEVEEKVLEAVDLESPEARQSNLDRYPSEQQLEIQQNLFGELLDQLEESQGLEEETPQYEDEVVDSLIRENPEPVFDGSVDDNYEDYDNEDNRNEGDEDDSLEEPLNITSETAQLYEEYGEAEFYDDLAEPVEEEEPTEDSMEDSLEESMEDSEEDTMHFPGENEMPREPEAMPRPEGEESEEENPTAKNFFDHYPRIYPFEDNEVIYCVKIEPKDIGMLPKEVWPLSNNSFLMHGFYCYHHLIFAKLKNRNGTFYVLGIPGIYHNRERFMAKMFGFENFKSIRKKDLRQGDFGYWYLPLNF